MWFLFCNIKLLSVTTTHKYRFSRYLERISHFKYELCRIHELPWRGPKRPSENRGIIFSEREGPEVAMRLLMVKIQQREQTGPQHDPPMEGLWADPCHYRHGAVYLPRGGAGFIYLITVPDFHWLHGADQLAVLVYSMILSSLNIYTAIPPVWKLQLFYSLWPKPGLLMPKFYITPASSTSQMARKFYVTNLFTSYHSSLCLQGFLAFVISRILESSNLLSLICITLGPRGHTIGDLCSTLLDGTKSCSVCCTTLI